MPGSKYDPRRRAPRGSKGPAYDAMLDAEAEKQQQYAEDRSKRRSRTARTIRTMRRQQKELDARMADMPKMKKGGKVRGCGRAERGVRAARMIKMKGA